MEPLCQEYLEVRHIIQILAKTSRNPNFFKISVTNSFL